MKIAIFDAKSYDKEFFDQENKTGHQISYIPTNLSLDNIEQARGFDAVSGFVNTPADEAILTKLAQLGVRFWLQRSMGYNRVDLKAAQKAGIQVFRVPNYSAETVGEHAVSLALALNRRLLVAKTRVQRCDFTLAGLEGRCIANSVVGVVGSGKIGQCTIKAFKGMGAQVLVFDEFAQQHFPQTAQTLGFQFVTYDELLAKSHFIFLHAPLLPTTKHMVNSSAIAKMQPGVIIVNAARGPLVDTTALVAGLKSGKIGGAGLDVLEREEGRFFLDLTAEEIRIKQEDPEWKYLLESDKVLVTAHQAFFSRLALTQIAQITLRNADEAQVGNYNAALQLQPDGTIKNG